MATKSPIALFEKRFAYNIRDTSRVTGLGKNKIYDEIRAGRLIAKKVGGRTVVTAKSIEQWLEGMPNVALASRSNEAA